MNLTDIYMDGEYWARRIMRIIAKLDLMAGDDSNEEVLYELSGAVNRMLTVSKMEYLKPSLPVYISNIE